MRTSWIPIVLLVSGLVAVVPRAHAKVPPCPGGRYLVAGTALTGAPDMPEPDVVHVDGKMVSVQSGCAAAKARVRGAAKGTKVRVRWKSCPGLVGPAVLSGTMMEQCRTLAGTFTAKKAGIAKPFIASLSLCGDGVWDAAGGEECDAGLGPCGDLCTACTCTGGGATTTTTTVVGQTSTTVPGGSTSTTTTPTTPTTSTTSGGGPGSTTTTSSPAPTTTTSPVPTTTTTIFVVPTTSSSTTTVIATTSSTMPALPTTSTTSTTLAGPNLVPWGWMSPGTAPAGTNIAVEFTVRNIGNQTATGPWYDYIMLSGDYAFGNDVAIDVVERVSNLSASSQYTVLRPQVPIPAVPPGTYYLYLQTDGTNAVAENDESNNVGGFVQLIVN
jgi:cell division septation protein DedD